MSLISFTEAIAKMEGFYADEPTRAKRNNNPGNIEYGMFAFKHGALRVEDAPIHGRPRFAYFPTPELGFVALRDLLLEHYKGMTVEQVISKYAPPSENNTTNYIKQVCDWVGCSSNSMIDKLL